MERFVFFLCCLLLSVNCQNLQNKNILNPDAFYFDDNRPGKATSSPVLPSSQLQPPFNGQSLNQAPVVTNTVDASLNNLNLLNPGNRFDTNIQQVTPVLAPNIAPSRNTNIQRPVIDPTVDVRNQIRPSQKNNGIIRATLDGNAGALTNFSINVMKSVIRQNQGNVVVSPYSIATVLALLQQGASQTTLDQITAALQMPVDLSAATYKSQTQDILARNSRNILRTANNIYIADAFSLNPQFKAVAQSDFNSEVTPSVFNQPSEASRIINQWVASKTDNKITKLLSPESLSVNTQMVLVNAIYFKGLWAVPFRPQATKLENFNIREGLVKKVPFMMIRRHFRAGIDSQLDARVVIVPFEFNEYSLLVILPSIKSNVQNTLASLTVSQLENYLNYRPMEVALQIPKFTIKADTDLTPVLRQMGVTQIFEQNSGLVGLGMYRTFTPQVSSAIHSALLSIDEDGSVAAAASAFTVVALSNDEPSMAVILDRPFVAVLWDEKNKVPLFMAKIEDPSL